jgi:uncharacterized RDD family membrane protein YckC
MTDRTPATASRGGAAAGSRQVRGLNAGLGRRLGAIIYDTLLAVALLALGTLPFIAVRGGEHVAAGEPWYRLTMLLILYAFFTGFWAGYGRTLGMQSWRIRIETADGRKPSLWQASLRFFAAILSWLPAGAGFWWQLLDSEGLSWHDRLSGTRLRYYPKQGIRR